MKRTLITFLLYFIYCTCFAQEKYKEHADSCGLVSRNKADKVLTSLNLDHSRILLYSISDKEYYIIQQQEQNFKEVFVLVDSISSILSIKEIDHVQDIRNLRLKRRLSNKDKKRLRNLIKDRKLLSESFETDRYHTEFITTYPTATYLEGVPSYFVLKDELNNRFGECRFFTLTVPCPIDPNLWVYLMREICICNDRFHTP